MDIWASLQGFVADTGPLGKYLMLFVIAGLLAAVGRGFLRARKIQPNGFQWKALRREMVWAVINVTASAFLIGGLSRGLTELGWVHFNTGPVSGWRIALEFAIYFFAFDCYFYWLHRLMHINPVYTWVHKVHHGSISPNPLTTLSVSPLESLINGGFVPLFTAALTVHESSFALIASVNIVMGLYVHSGYEFLPRWWNRSWITKWFITATFHDQHHRYFRGNYGGYTTIWDWLCGTVRPNYLADFDRIKGRSRRPAQTEAIRTEG